MRLLLLRVGVLLRKELLQVLRDPRLRYLMFFPPLLQLVAFGYAANLDLRNIPIALYDEDRSPLSRDLAFAFSASGYFRFVTHITQPDEMARLIDRGRVKAVLHFGPDLSERVQGGKTALAQVIVAGTNSNTASLVQSYSAQIVERFNRGRLKQRIDRNPLLKKVIPSGSEGIIRLESRIWYNEELLSRNFYVPGIIALVIMVSVLNLTAMAVVRE
ncbi:MAG: ABC transporter permease, partial [Deltaproteobacteria bacterium]|nr:ABC transporter permease [Deltaproteobacteria bacterium]